jgi:soluble lytic murein transglycosylase-like protein
LDNDFLTTVAWIESRFDPKAGKTRPYKGLFQIGNDAFSDLKKTYKNRAYSNSSVIPMDTVENTQMGNDYLKWAYDRFQNNLDELEKTKA